MTVPQLCGPMAFHVLQWCRPMLAYHNEDKLLYPDDHLIWCSKVHSGPHTKPGCCLYLDEPSDAFCFVGAFEDLYVLHHLLADDIFLLVVGNLCYDLC